MRLSHTRFTVTAGAVIFNDKREVLLLKHRFRAGSGRIGGSPAADRSAVEVLFRARANAPVRSRTIEVDRAEWFAIDSLPEGLPRDQKVYIERAAKRE